MNADYLADVIPAPFTVLGKRLRPLSITRLLYLHRFGCFPIEGLAELLTAVIVCSRPCKEILPTLNDRWLGLKLKLWAWRLGKFSLVEKVDLFRGYIEAHTRRPPVWCPDSFDDGQLPGAEFLQHLKVTLKSECGWSQEEIDEEPASKAYWDYYTFWEIKDRVRIQEIETSTEMELKAEANRRHEEILAKANGTAPVNGRVITPEMIRMENAS